MQITDKAQKTIKGNYNVIGALMAEFQKGQKQLDKWIDNKDIRLTTPSAVEIIKSITGLKEEEILEPKVHA